MSAHQDTLETRLIEALRPVLRPLIEEIVVEVNRALLAPVEPPKRTPVDAVTVAREVYGLDTSTAEARERAQQFVIYRARRGYIPSRREGSRYQFFIEDVRATVEGVRDAAEHPA